ncbi:hypothetical protein [Streptomyces sp. NPDC050988]|uniref:hypothetical protein n=1 Tax=Streptomyces sp. NPDC050988 TaxID=3365637 RepID=UPI00379473AC
MGQHKNARSLIRAVKDQGFTVEPDDDQASGRRKVTAPDGKWVIMPGPKQRTAGRALLNARAALRRIGADV